jgi:GNAT superfamily N-acetyltransferase
MTIEVTSARSSQPVAEYASIPIAFEVKSVFSAQAGVDGAFVLIEDPVAHPYIKDYDAHGERPEDWATRFDTSRWALLLARDEGCCVGAAAVAFDTPDVDMLEGRTDLAVLWDIRVSPAVRRRGVGRRLFQAAENWASAQGCRELKVETQNINVAACRFYAALGCELRIVREEVYPACPGEAQFLWYKPLAPRDRERGLGVAV